jgi:hypothetical protein
MADGRPDLLEPLVAGLPYLTVEALWAVRREMAGSVSDVLDRRTQSSYRDARAAAAAAPSVAALIGPELGWDDERIRSEAETYASRVRADLTRAGLDPRTVVETRSVVAGDGAPAVTAGGTGDPTGRTAS